MAAGDVKSGIFAIDEATISGGIAAMRTGANDKWLMCTIGNGLQVLVINVEEA